ncbi:hypothetical protein B0H63DRAFT_232896 [Podospora didyma]|uniref:Uncharacterized protein n=1 Tax=Podospora didyma TaxID=330526 RepID=A0AAE0NCW0_9PEZI|nr:hypothetical protein B0H63DRAFT_232896 [Podospora didyma]
MTESIDGKRPLMNDEIATNHRVQGERMPRDSSLKSKRKILGQLPPLLNNVAVGNLNGRAESLSEEERVKLDEHAPTSPTPPPPLPPPPQSQPTQSKHTQPEHTKSEHTQPKHTQLEHRKLEHTPSEPTQPQPTQPESTQPRPTQSTSQSPHQTNPALETTVETVKKSVPGSNTEPSTNSVPLRAKFKKEWEEFTTGLKRAAHSMC